MDKKNVGQSYVLFWHFFSGFINQADQTKLGGLCEKNQYPGRALSNHKLFFLFNLIDQNRCLYIFKGRGLWVFHSRINFEFP